MTAALAVGAFLFGVRPAAAESAEDLLQQGILAQTGERNFDKAADLYRRAVEAAGSSQREVAAKAELQLGLCYEALLKKEEAMTAFQAALTLEPDAYGTLHDIAQTHLDQMRRESAAAAAPPAAIREPGRLELSFSGGRAYFKGDHVNIAGNTETAWASLGYRLGKRFGAGLEGGDFLSSAQETTVSATRPPPLSGPYQWNRQARLTSSEYYIGGFLQSEFVTRRLGGSLRAGAGVFAQTTRVDDQNTVHSLDGAFDDYSYGTSQRNSNHDPALSLAAMLHLRLTSWLDVGGGVRGLWVFQKGDYLSNALTEVSDPLPVVHYSTYKVFAAVIPFAELEVRL